MFAVSTLHSALPQQHFRLWKSSKGASLYLDRCQLDPCCLSWSTSTWRNKLRRMTQEKQTLQQKKRLCCMEAFGIIHSTWRMQWTTCMKAVSFPSAAGLETTAGQSQGNGLIQLLDYARDEFEWRHHNNAGGILSLALQSAAEQSKMLLLAGSMDGSVTLLDAHTGTVLTRLKAHAKYCVRVQWAPDSSHCVSCSWDHTMAVFTHIASTNEPSLQLQKTTTYLSQVQDVVFIPGAEPSDQLLAVALKNTNYLRLFDVHQLKEHSKVNMNARGDDHVSFSASHLAVSPCQRYLLVSTDGSRIIMFRLKDWTQTRNFYGLSVEEKFHQPCAAWHKNSFYIFAAAAAGTVYVFHVGTTKVEARLKAHLKNVRALDYNAETNTLVTCSFDKAVKVFT
ncbi:TPA: hypothetical protein ACH3X1_012194 [Trebouxia sp. C0004]